MFTCKTKFRPRFEQTHKPGPRGRVSTADQRSPPWVVVSIRCSVRGAVPPAVGYPHRCRAVASCAPLWEEDDIVCPTYKRARNNLRRTAIGGQGDRYGVARGPTFAGVASIPRTYPSASLGSALSLFRTGTRALCYSSWSRKETDRQRKTGARRTTERRKNGRWFYRPCSLHRTTA